jgi:hypothetical protein
VPREGVVVADPDEVAPPDPLLAFDPPADPPPLPLPLPLPVVPPPLTGELGRLGNDGRLGNAGAR